MHLSLSNVDFIYFVLDIHAIRIQGDFLECELIINPQIRLCSLAFFHKISFCSITSVPAYCRVSSLHGLLADGQNISSQKTYRKVDLNWLIKKVTKALENMKLVA